MTTNLKDTKKQVSGGFEEVKDAATDARLAMKEGQSRIELEMVTDCEGARNAHKEIMNLLRT